MAKLNYMEPEVLEAELKKLECPYTHTDPRASVWLDGWRVGYKVGSDQGIAALERLTGTAK